MKYTDAWKYAELLAQVTRENTKIVRLPSKLAKRRGEAYAFTCESYPLAGEIVGVAVYTPKE